MPRREGIGNDQHRNGSESAKLLGWIARAAGVLIQPLIRTQAALFYSSITVHGRPEPSPRGNPVCDLPLRMLAAAARFHKSPVEQRSGLARLGCDDLRRDAPEIRSSDVRLRTERIEDLPRSGNEGCGASRTERANDIPRMRGHES
jgi:hypothetical protein